MGLRPRRGADPTTGLALTTQRHGARASAPWPRETHARRSIRAPSDEKPRSAPSGQGPTHRPADARTVRLPNLSLKVPSRAKEASRTAPLPRRIRGWAASAERGRTPPVRASRSASSHRARAGQRGGDLAVQVGPGRGWGWRSRERRGAPHHNSSRESALSPFPGGDRPRWAIAS